MEFFHGFGVDENDIELDLCGDMHGAEHEVGQAHELFTVDLVVGFVKNFSHDSASIVSVTGVQGTVTACFEAGHGFVPTFVCVNNLADKAMTHNIGACQMTKFYVIDATENIFNDEKTAGALPARSICEASPVTTTFELKPKRVRNIFICASVVF